MPRDIPVGNGSLLVNFDQSYQLRDLYWPHVGQENHTYGHPFRFGVWVDGQFSWISGPDWRRTLDYTTHTLVTRVELQNAALALRLMCEDAVDFHEDLYLRHIRVFNDADHDREVRLFFTHDFHISGNEVGDTAYYEPDRRAVFHHKGKRWFLINTGRKQHDDWLFGVDQWAVGVKEVGQREGTWRDAEDGQLSGNPVAQGSVDSAVAMHLQVPGHGQTAGWYWIAAAEDFLEVTRINRTVRHKTPPVFLQRTHDYWSLWATKENTSFGDLPEPIRRLYYRSLLVIRTQIDNQGAIVAGSDFDVVNYNRDIYAYMWPRDGALVAAALIGGNHSELSRSFFNFCCRVITNEGYLLHRYNADGSLASSWLSWVEDGRKVLPVQEDETALVLWALWRHFKRFRDVEFIKPLFRDLICRAANWMVEYRDEQTGLPLTSWDLWEERRGISAWTVGTVWAGLQAAASFADAFGESALAGTYRQAAAEVRAGSEAHLWRADLGRFVRLINRAQAGGGWEVDPTLDASLTGLWYFGMFAADDPRMVATMKMVRERLWVKTGVGGIARYENDPYYQISQDTENVPGNPWFICTLWLAQWHIATAQTLDDLKPALESLSWAASHALLSGVMAEQVHPYSDAPLSVSPLTWSHATLVNTVQEYVDRLAALTSQQRE